MITRQNPTKLHLATLFNLTTLFISLILLDSCLSWGISALYTSSYIVQGVPVFQLASLRSAEVLVLAILYRKKLLSIFGTKDLSSFLKNVGIGLSLSLLGTLAYFGMNFMTDLFTGQPLPHYIFGSQSREFSGSSLNLFYYLLLAGVIAPLAEEFFFRGILLSECASARNKFREIVFYDLILIFLFVLPHIQFGHFNPIDPLIWGSCAFLTIRLYSFTGSVVAGIIVHGSANVLINLITMGFI